MEQGNSLSQTQKRRLHRTRALKKMKQTLAIMADMKSRSQGVHLLN